MVTLKTLMDNPDVIFDMFNSNKDHFTEKEYIIISNKLRKIESSLMTHLDKKPSIFNGFTKFNLDKLINLILILSDKGILKTKLLKEYFKDYNSREIVNFSHKEKAFTETKEFNEISYDYAFDINIEIE